MNPGLAPRDPSCGICRTVAAPEHVTALMFSEDGQRIGRAWLVQARKYLRSVGVTTLPRRWLRAHGLHVQKYLDGERTPMAPVLRVISTVPQVVVPPSFVEVVTSGMGLGMDAQRLLADRLDEMEDKDLIAVAKLGQAAAGRYGDWAAKGRQLDQAAAIVKRAAGLPG